MNMCYIFDPLNMLVVSGVSKNKVVWSTNLEEAQSFNRKQALFFVEQLDLTECQVLEISTIERFFNEIP